MKRFTLFLLACIIGASLSGCGDVYAKGQAAQYAKSLGYSKVKTFYLERSDLCGDGRYHMTVAWTANGATKGGIVCIRGEELRPLPN
jgi:uncharacterized protein YceK